MVSRRLEARYRRLLRAYPRRYRETRGLEMLTTLLDGAYAGQHRPSWAETKDLIVGGLRNRVRLPGGRGMLLLGVVLAFAAGALGAAAAGWLGWRNAGPLPDDARTRQIAAIAFGTDRDVAIDRRDVLFDYDVDSARIESFALLLLGGDDYRPGWVDATHHSGQPVAVLATARVRLAAAGWQVYPQRRSGEFTAAKDSFVIHGSVSEYGAAMLSVKRAEPASVIPATVTGWLLGMFAGWLLTGGVGRRLQRHSPAVRSGSAALAGTGAALLVPASLITVAGVLVSWFDGTPNTSEAPWAGYMLLPLRSLTIMGLMALLLVIGLATRRYTRIDGIYRLP